MIFVGFVLASFQKNLECAQLAAALFLRSLLRTRLLTTHVSLRGFFNNGGSEASFGGTERQQAARTPNFFWRFWWFVGGKWVAVRAFFVDSQLKITLSTPVFCNETFKIARGLT